jgi:hypothetical protein
MLEVPKPETVAKSLTSAGRAALRTAIPCFDGYVLHPDLVGDLRERGLVEIRSCYLGAFGIAVRKVIIERQMA